MDLTPEQCYAALLARDRRFDGRFFTAVRTTGIYCRPVCPARTPHLQNVTFYAHAAAAEEAGYRPCRRCRPELAPGSTEWAHTPPAVSRALRLIDQGALDHGDIDDVCEQVGVGARQLRRLFVQHVGAAPAAVARSRRAHFARQLLDETDLTVTEIAFAAGFRSLRAFNETMKEIFERTPSELRARRSQRTRSGLTVRLSFRPPLDWPSTLAWLLPRLTRGVEQIDGATYGRTIDGGTIHVTRMDEASLRLTVDAGPGADLLAIVGRVRRMFDLDADPLTIETHLRRDPLLAPAVQRHPGLRVAGGWDTFEVAVRTVLGQQISVAAATTLAGRIAEHHGKPLDAPDGTLTHRFPTPDALADADLRSLGTTTAQQRAIHALARARLTSETSLLALPGIGPWSANLIAMRAFGDPDAFPANDLGLVRAAGLNAKELIARAEHWRPWRAYAAMYLWRTL